MSQPYTPPPVPPQPVPPAKKSKPFGWLALIIAVASALVVGSCTGAMARGSGTTTAAPGDGPTVTVTETVKAKPGDPAPTETVTVTAEPEQAEDPEPAEEPSGLADGTYEVGVDIKPGRYKTVVPDDSYGCYWARLKDDSGEFDAIISNENGEPGSRMSVTIKKSDGFFESRNCGEWTKS